MKVTFVRNVNEAIDELRHDVLSTEPRYGDAWLPRNSRGGDVLELDCQMATVYEYPCERVSFSRARDANPFFHFFEALWILAGREDVEFLKLFNVRMGEYSDDGVKFHAPYGYRLRRHFKDAQGESIDQIMLVIRMLLVDPDTRRAVMAIWDPRVDLGTQSLDIPCNDVVFFKLRPGTEAQERYLDMTVCCRSNDAIWGAYGANAVQFSMIQELIASSIAAQVGSYTQISDSFHIYTDNEPWKRMTAGHDWRCDPYPSGKVKPYPIMQTCGIESWLIQCQKLCGNILHAPFVDSRELVEPFFVEVALPMWKAWWNHKKHGPRQAIEFLEGEDLEIDWLAAAMQWLIRRVR